MLVLKKVLSIGILLGTFVLGTPSGSAEINRYDCSRFNDSLSECWLSNKCEVKEVETGEINAQGSNIMEKTCVVKGGNIAEGVEEGGDSTEEQIKADTKTAIYDAESECETLD